MSLTGVHHAFASLHEEGLRVAIEAFRAARPWYFSYATSMLGGGPPPATATLMDPIAIPGSAVSFHYRIDVLNIVVDCFPANAGSGLPVELAPLVADEFSLRADLQMTVLCPRRIIRRQVVAWEPISARLSLWLVGSPTATPAVGGAWRLGISSRGVEIVDITPKELESILGCFLQTVLTQALLPRLTFLLDKITTDFFTLTLADGPHVNDDRIFVLGNLSPPPPGTGGGGPSPGIDLSFLIPVPGAGTRATHLVAAVDEDGAETIVSSVATGLSDSTSGSALGFSYSVAWQVVPGDFELVDAGDMIRLREWDLHTDISLGWSFDLSTILPDVCIPEVCVWTPFGEACTPSWCIDWPTIGVDFSLPTIVSEISVDFSLQIYRDPAAAQWVIAGVVNPFTLDIDIIDLADTAAELFEDTLGAVLSSVPGIGPFLSDAISWILSTVLDLLDDLMEGVVTALSDSLQLNSLLGIGFELHRVDEVFELVSVAGSEPAVNIRIASLASEITSDRELVVSADVAVP